ncbi:probable disease resistance protein At1g61300 [Cryptomeria japonica]|uniref:probable disease resistance protein At1g61300 n=1 Tax=Cryptomeria japonica TaxID=3369 RepID=UPI0027DA0A8D|nr:probable disease resistance protein At1g61300 [Cryptomeria japonica]
MEDKDDRVWKGARDMAGKLEKWDKVELILNDLDEKLSQRVERNAIEELNENQEELMRKLEEMSMLSHEMGLYNLASLHAIQNKIYHTKLKASCKAQLEELETWLLKDDSVRVVGVYGMPGVGKTFMLKHINNNEKVVNFFELVIWVTLSRDSDISDLQRRICERIELPWRSNSSIDEAEEFLHSVFKEKPLLLILDDVWKRIDVSKLGISPFGNKIKIVLASRDKEVCRSMKADKMIAMKQLSEEDGAFPAGEDQNMDSEIEPLARSIARECKGHPLAIKTLARTVPDLQNSTPSEWVYVLKQLKAIDPEFYRIHREIVEELFKRLKQSYDALESDELRLCFLYLAAYREDEEIDADELIQLWLAEGLVKSREEGRHGFLGTLANRCLVDIEVREANGHQIWKVKIHDVLRDMAVHVPEVEQNILFRAGQSLTEFPKSAIATSVRISLMHNLYLQFQSLLLSWNTVEEVPESFLEKLNMLKLSRLQFLDLSFSSLKNIPSMIKKLKSLQTLNLAHCYDLEFVSGDISHLTSLEELDLWKSTMFGNSRDVRGGGESREASLQELKSSQILLTLSGLGLARLSNLNEIDIEECLLLTELGEYFGRKGCFPRLCKLALWMLPFLESVCSFVEEGALPMLQTLTIFHCMKVKVLPQDLDNLNSLEQIKEEKEWWNEISWRNEEMKQHLHDKYVEIVEIHDKYHA